MNPYEVLEIPYDSDNDTIKKSYKRLAMKYHPDKNKDPEAEEKFKEISKAYQELTTDSSLEKDFPELSELFNLLKFGNLFRGVNVKGQPVVTSIELTLEEIFEGGIFDCTYYVQKFVYATKKINNTIVQERILESIEKHIDITVEPCFNPNIRPLIIPDSVEYSDNTKGDLYIQIKQIDHSFFQRENDDLLCTMEITLKEALTGFDKTITHLNKNTFTISCKNVVGPDTEKKIEGLGMVETGSLILKFKIIFPKELDREVIEKIGQLL